MPLGSSPPPLAVEGADVAGAGADFAWTMNTSSCTEVPSSDLGTFSVRLKSASSGMWSMATTFCGNESSEGAAVCSQWLLVGSDGKSGRAVADVAWAHVSSTSDTLFAIDWLATVRIGITE